MNSVNFRKYLQYVFWVLIAYIFLNSLYYIYADANGQNKISYCGKIEKKIIEQYYHKSSGNTDYIMIINFEKVGRKEIDVSRTTYFGKNEGDDICFDFDKDKFGKSASHIFWIICGVLSAFVCCLGIVFLVCNIVSWIFTGKFLQI